MAMVMMRTTILMMLNHKMTICLMVTITTKTIMMILIHKTTIYQMVS